MENRKTLVEVTPEEYMKIMDGYLTRELDTIDLSSISTSELIDELTKRSSNVKTNTFYSSLDAPVDPLGCKRTIIVTKGRLEFAGEDESKKDRFFEWTYTRSGV